MKSELGLLAAYKALMESMQEPDVSGGNPPNIEKPKTIPFVPAKTSAKILKGLKSRQFADWFEKEFTRWNAGGSDVPEEEIIQDIQALFNVA